MSQLHDAELAALSQASLGYHQPFVLRLPEGELHLQQVLRALPNRRVVLHGRWQGKPVVVKAFLGAQAERYAQRDLRGIALFAQGQIASPALVAQYHQAQLVLLILQAIGNSQNAQQFFQQADQTQRRDLLIALSATLAKQHQAGLLQQDMHPNNFLIQQSKQGQALKVYSLDGDAVAHYKRISVAQSLRNLATLLAKFEVLCVQQTLPDCLQAYCQIRAWPPISASQQARLLALMRKLRLQMLHDYADKKVFRQCSDVRLARQQGWSMWIASDMAITGAELQQALQQAFAQPNYLKQGNTCTVVRGWIGQQDSVIKRYNIKNFLHRLSRAWRPTRASLSWANAHRLRLLNIATPKPLALLEKRRFGWRSLAYYLSETIEGVSLKQFAEQIPKRQQPQAAVSLAELFYRLQLIGIAHGDCKADNFKWHAKQWWILDLDSMRQHSCPPRALKAHIRDLKRLFANWQADDSLYNVMFSAFAARYADSPAWRLADLSRPSSAINK